MWSHGSFIRHGLFYMSHLTWEVQAGVLWFWCCIYEHKSEVVLKTFTLSTNSQLLGHDFCLDFMSFFFFWVAWISRSWVLWSSFTGKLLAVKLEFQVEFNPWDPHSKRKEPNSGLLKSVCDPTHMYSHFYACAGVHIFTYKHTQIIKRNVVIILKSFQLNHQAVCTHFSLSSSLYVSI